MHASIGRKEKESEEMKGEMTVKEGRARRERKERRKEGRKVPCPRRCTTSTFCEPPLRSLVC
jgi:hypothetical protein